MPGKVIPVVRKYRVDCFENGKWRECCINISKQKAAKKLADRHAKRSGVPHRVVPYIDTPGLRVRRVKP